MKDLMIHAAILAAGLAVLFGMFALSPWVPLAFVAFVFTALTVEAYTKKGDRHKPTR